MQQKQMHLGFYSVEYEPLSSTLTDFFLRGIQEIFLAQEEPRIPIADLSNLPR